MSKININKIKRVACYVRVSTENQLENYSIEEQIDRLEAFCKAKDWNIVKFYTDGGYSGGNLDRPALQQMIADIANKHIDMVVVYKLDRLSRSQKDTLTLIEDKFLSNNADFVSMSENFDTSTPFGRAMIGILSVFAQLEKDQITERFTMGRVGRAKNGYYHGGSTPPTGYDYINGELIINEYEAIQVREVFNRFLDGHSMHSIRKYMNEHYANKYGNWNNHALITNILRNNIYIGCVKFKGMVYPGNHKPIIPNDIFEKTQNLLTNKKEENSKIFFQKTPFRANHLLTSLLFCKKCGARFCGSHGNYVCYSRGKSNRDKIVDPNCKNKRWKVAELDNILKNEILRLAFDDDYFNKTVAGKKLDTTKANMQEIMQRICEIDKQIARIIDLYQINGITFEQITDRVEKLKKEKDVLSQQFADGKKSKINLDEVKDILSGAREVFGNGVLPKQRLLVSNLIDYIEIDDAFVDICWSFV